MSNPTSLSTEAVVTQDMLACSVGSGSLPVLATPAVAALFEQSASLLAQKYLDEGITSVGTKLSLSHDAPTAPGAHVTATATLVAQEGRVFRFTLEARDDAGVIATGTHERVSVKAATFPAKAEARLPKP